MNKKYLAYIALLAGWLCLCYWLYAKGIFPRLYGFKEKSWTQGTEDLPYPLTFRWASDVLLAGKGIKELKSSFEHLDSADIVLIIRGYYFRDEADSHSQLVALGQGRINNALRYLKIDHSRVVTEVLPQEINADVRANPFEAIRFEQIPVSQVMIITGDTLEFCFPLKDSMSLPRICYERLNNWRRHHIKNREGKIHVTGTADGSGIAESADVAMDRALVIKKELIQEGWEEDRIRLSTGQRNHPHAIRNRCAVVYFE